MEALAGNPKTLATEWDGDTPWLLADWPNPAGADCPPPSNVGEWRAFSAAYRDELLLAHEWPAIREAHRLTLLGYGRELVALDQTWGRTQRGLAPVWRALAAAGARLGQQRLHRLRPLQAERSVRRYVAAVDSAEATGWHTVVFGLLLGVHSLPLRQGLLHYAQQSLGGFLQGTPLAKLDDCTRMALLAEATAGMVPRLNKLLAAESISSDRVSADPISGEISGEMRAR